MSADAVSAMTDVAVAFGIGYAGGLAFVVLILFIGRSRQP